MDLSMRDTPDLSMREMDLSMRDMDLSISTDFCNVTPFQTIFGVHF